MPKYICQDCKRILIRTANEMRFADHQSYCERSGTIATLIRLRIPRRETGRSGTIPNLPPAVTPQR